MKGRHEDHPEARALMRAVASAEEAVIVTDVELAFPGPRILYVNPAFERMTGYASHELIGATPRIFQGPETERTTLDRLHRALTEGGSFVGTTVNYRKDGASYVVQWRAEPYRDETGAIRGYVSLQRPVDVEPWPATSGSNSLIREVFEQHAVPMLLLDADNGLIMDANQSAEEFYGYSREALRQMPISQINMLTSEELRAELARAQYQRSSSIVLDHCLANNEVRKVEVNSSPVTISGRGYIHSIVHDISEQQRLASEARERLYYDPDTGLPNQIAFRQQLAAYEPGAPDGDMGVTAIILQATDLDDIVDTVGIQVADRVLVALGEQLRELGPEIHGAYRVSLSEIGLIVEVSDEKSVRRVAEQLHDAAAKPLEINGTRLRFEPALGIGHAGKEGPRDAGDLIWRARIALRRAVATERDWVSYEPALEAASRSTPELIAAVDAGLDAQEFELYYQPKLRLADGASVGTEALARWCPPGGETVPPGQFMPKLEHTSLISRFTQFVISAAIEHARAGELRPVAVNLAARNLRDESLIDALIDAMDRSGLAGEDLEVEITESALMRDAERAIALLRRLRDHGILVSIDDFGTGYASFAYLRHLPATNLKIDRSFVQVLETEPKTRKLVHTMIEAGHALGLTITAEGVETAEQMRILTGLGCDLAQGFLWTPPLAHDEILRWLAEHGATGPSAD
jgi:PAS domain S-box-containing protein